jgi:hypothetical protein
MLSFLHRYCSRKPSGWCRYERNRNVESVSGYRFASLMQIGNGRLRSLQLSLKPNS